jgi:hypothetical protein
VKRILEFDKDEGGEFRIALDSPAIYSALFEVHEICFKASDAGGPDVDLANQCLDIIRNRCPNFMELEE